MKKVILLVTFMPVMAFGQIKENFESGTITNWIQSSEGHWKAESAESISGDFSLHHIYDDSQSGSDCIGLPLTNLHPDEGTIRWSFLLRHGCDPSSSNYWTVYLMSDTDPVSFIRGINPCGFAIGVNLTGYDDTLRLWKIKSGQTFIIATCTVNWQDDIGIANVAKIVVDRSINGIWNISVYDSFNKLSGTALGADNELFGTEWLLVNYRYTSTRDKLLWFDDLDIEGVYHEDNKPPEILSYRFSGMNSIEITLDEAADEKIMQPDNFSVNNENNKAINVRKKTALIYQLEFENEFNNKSINNLNISQLCDRSGNCASNINLQFTPVWAETGDVIISEIMADPLPVVSLPGKEYLEIYNRTKFTYDLKNWKLSVLGQSASIPSAELKPEEYIILCSFADTSLYMNYGKVTGLKSFPALTDEERMIYLTDSLGNLIHGVEYSSGWYGNKLKEEGGWSLEIIDTGFPFYSTGNWEASSSGKGGTPGSVNSSSRSNPDGFFHGIENVFTEDSVTVNAIFSETLPDITDYHNGILIGGNRIVTIFSSDPLLRRFTLEPAEPLVRGKIYSINIPLNVTDFANNSITRSTFKFGIPENAAKKDIVFNELLFNPYPDDPDFVEIFNCSEKIIDASRLYLASVNDATGDTSEIKQISEEHRCIIPGSFYTVTTDREKIIKRYSSSDQENIFNVASIPSMSDDIGHLLLLNREMQLIDEVYYNDRMHYSLLVNNEGVSLEKIRPEINSGESMNWHSASESSGFGTPGVVNSVFCPGITTSDQVVFSSGRISPDNNGIDDVLVIDFNLNGIGNIISITIFDETGSYVRKIAENFFAGDEASLIWDGTANDGSLVNTGIYIVLIELYNDKGKIKTWKKVCTVIR